MNMEINEQIPKNNLIIGKRIRIKREEKELSQEDLGLKTGYGGRAAINKIEKGKSNIPISKLIFIAQVLNTPVDYFLAPIFFSESLILGDPTPEETEIIAIYHSLDDMGKSIIKGELYKQKLRCDSIENK